MKILSTGLIYFIGLLHLWFMVLESFLWTKPIGLKTFKMTPEMAEATKVMAQNQGLYNAFLALGLFWGAFSGDIKITVFFLSCVLVAGIVGGMTASKGILYVQALPALITLILVLMTAKS